jgi:hypothetical protein
VADRMAILRGASAHITARRHDAFPFVYSGVSLTQDAINPD